MESMSGTIHYSCVVEIVWWAQANNIEVKKGMNLVYNKLFTEACWV